MEQVVTGLVELDKKRYQVYLDEEFAFVLYKGEIRKYKIAVGKPLAQTAYQELVQEILPKRAKLRAMNLLTKRPYTEKKLRQKLAEGKYPEEIIDVALAYVKSYGYIDDEAYARDYISYHMASESPLRIRQKLMEKGIDGDIINACLEEQDEEAVRELQIRQIQQLAQKKNHGQFPADPRESAKVIQYLLRKGYAMSLIKDALSADLLEDLYK
ncbi:recombination regulator RecX [Kineothrix sp. MSJ-39]|uniref:regulatory protein RecX n=1 Tax=Kineothrix sp. MSJ-39 TaxID=2841533 RepID=UPI001C126472|nr:regulatory protein RecX [Kineothrix sp. MSJ-39]MBU5430249.1 recombination regulator RecX [Kineothrix sp. MSJ-39]